jgi:2-desacetyl-2-hydroxyethyl bacteriochlorophyllide A dehydrogenase
MKAAVFRQIGQSLALEEIPKPKIGPEDVLVETRTCGICRTDVHILDGLAYIPNLPHVPGHEPAGVVAEIGEKVRHLKPGHRVLPHLFLTCGQCYYCRVGRDSLCSQLKGILGVTTPGGFAEYFVAPARNLFVLPDGIPFEMGGLVSCAVITAVHAFRKARLSVNDCAVIVGGGGIGQLLIQLLKAAGVRVAVTGRSDETLEIARSLGADLTVRSGAEDTMRQLRQLTGGSGIQCVFDCVGIAKTMGESASYVMDGGKIIVIGEEAEFPAIDTVHIAQRELEIIGSRNGSKQDVIDCLDMMNRGLIKPTIVKKFSLDEIGEAIDFVRRGQAHGRVVIEIKK